MTTPITRSFHYTCRAILASEKANGYAKSYAKAGLGLYDNESIRVQCLYILNNIAHWRGENSKECRTTLKRLSKLDQQPVQW